MPLRFLAWRVVEPDAPARLVETDVPDLRPGEVLIRVDWSGINFKDALAVSGRGHVARRIPVTCGSDAAGVVEASTDQRYARGAAVIAGGITLGEDHDGGFARFLQVPGSWVLPLPPGLTSFEAMALGTAGFSAALALHKLEAAGLSPAMGPVVVTGASGAVGSYAVSLLASQGYHVIAVSSRPAHAAYLRSLGARETCTPDGLGLRDGLLEKGRFGGVIDCVGGELLGRLLRHVRPMGAVVAVGHAAGTVFQASVYPFILRGLSLLGLSATHTPIGTRHELWQRLGGGWKPPHIPLVADRVIPFEQIAAGAADVLERRARGRVVVDCRGLAAVDR